MSDDDMTEITRHHAERINRAHEAAQAAARSAVEHALEAGRLLLEVKAGLEHGRLGDWITEHCRFSPRTAQSYMRLARELPKLDEAKAQRVADLPFRDALKALSKPKPLVDLGDIPPADYARATEAQGTLRRYAAFCEQHPPERIAKAFKPHEVAALRQYVAEVQSWIGQFSEALPRQDEASDSEAHDLLQRIEQQHARFKDTMRALKAETDPAKAGELMRQIGDILRDDSLMVEAVKLVFGQIPEADRLAIGRRGRVGRLWAFNASRQKRAKP